MHGYFENNRLYLEITVSGTLKQSKKTIKTHVDTGYDGDLSLPFSEAFPFGFALVGTKTYVIADGSTLTNFSCLGQIDIDGKKIDITVDVIPNGSILLGMALLPKLCKEIKINFINNQFILKR